MGSRMHRGPLDHDPCRGTEGEVRRRPRGHHRVHEDVGHSVALFREVVVPEAGFRVIGRGQEAHGVQAMDDGGGEIGVTPVDPRHLVVHVLDPGWRPDGGQPPPRLADQGHEPPVEGDLMGHDAPLALRGRDELVHLVQGASGRLLDQEREAVLEQARPERRREPIGYDQRGRVGPLGLDHGREVRIGAREAELRAVARRARGVEVAAAGQVGAGMLRDVPRLRGTVRAQRVLATADHAEARHSSQGGNATLHPRREWAPPLKPPVVRRGCASPGSRFGYSPSTVRAPVSTTSKSEPFRRERLSSPWSRRSGAIDISQSPPLSATSMP